MHLKAVTYFISELGNRIGSTSEFPKNITMEKAIIKLLNDHGNVISISIKEQYGKDNVCA